MAETSVGSIKYDLNLDDSKFSAGVNAASDKVKGLGGWFKQAESASFAFAAGLAAIGAAAGAFAVKSVAAFNESQKELAQLDAVLASTKGAAGLTRDEIISLSASLQQQSTFSDEAVLSAENLLLTFTKVGKEVFPQATQTILDMSIALGQDTKASAIQLGKALQDPILGISALRRVGVNFSEDQKKVIEHLVNTGHSLDAQKLILKELNTEFGGSAAAAADTFSGRITILKNNFNDFQELIGKAISERLGPLVGAFNDWMKAMGGPEGMMKSLGEITQRLIDNLPILIGIIIGGLTPAIIALGSALLFTVLPAFLALLPFLIVGGLIGLGIKAIMDNWTLLVALWNSTITTVTTLWTTIYTAFVGGWTAIVVFFTVSIPAFIASFILWFSMLPQMLLDFVWNVIILGFVEFIAMLIGLAVFGIPALINTIIGFLAGLPGMVWNILTIVYNFFVTSWSNIKSWLNTAVPAMIADIMSFINTLPGKVWAAMMETKGQAVAGIQSTWSAILAEVSQWPQRMFDWGSRLMHSMADGIRSAIGAIADAFRAGMDNARKLVEGHSPPVAGPFKDIDKWGFNVGDAWVQGFYNAVDGLKMPNIMGSNFAGVGLGSGVNSGGTSNNVNIYVDKVGDQQDIEAIGRELAFRLNIA